MPVIGIFAGRYLGGRFAFTTQIAGGCVLLAVAVHAWREAFDDEAEVEGLRFDSPRAATLAGIAISTDELAVGFPLGAAHLPIASLLGALALQTFFVTAAGIALGRRLGRNPGQRASRYAGMVAALAFCGLGVLLLVEAFGGVKTLR